MGRVDRAAIGVGRFWNCDSARDSVGRPALAALRPVPPHLGAGELHMEFGPRNPARMTPTNTRTHSATLRVNLALSRSKGVAPPYAIALHLGAGGRGRAGGLPRALHGFAQRRVDTALPAAAGGLEVIEDVGIEAEGLLAFGGAFLRAAHPGVGGRPPELRAAATPGPWPARSPLASTRGFPDHQDPAPARRPGRRRQPGRPWVYRDMAAILLFMRSTEADGPHLRRRAP